MKGSGYPAHAGGVASRLVGGEAVVVVPARREAHVLNETGSTVWTLMDGSRPESEIASELAGRYRVDVDVAARDLEGFIADLASRGAAAVLDRAEPSLAPRGAARESSGYEPPAVAETHPMEVVAALCASSRTGGAGGPPSPKPGKCRADASLCKKLFE